MTKKKQQHVSVKNTKTLDQGNLFCTFKEFIEREQCKLGDLDLFII